MRRLLLIAFVCLFSSIHAQNNVSIINEEFNDISIPNGWYTAGNGSNNWYVSPSFSAGGKPNEMQLSWSPQFSGISRLVSPAVDLTNITNAMMSLDHYVALFGNTGATIGVATSSDDGVTWNSVWSEKYTETNKQYSVVESISGPDMGKSDVRFCIYFEGSSSAIQSWYFDNFKVYTVEDLNIEMTSIDIPTYINHGEHNISFSVTNVGESAVKSFEARCIINGNEVLSETFYTEISYLETKQVTFEDFFNFSVNNSYDIEIEIFRVNDSEDDSSNNSTSKTVETALGETQRIPMIEHFSSSTCSPCPTANYGMEMLTANNPNKYTYTKYSMNFPGMGDPYFTTECETKRFYYNMGGAPELYLDGTCYGNKFIDNEYFNNQYNVPALANVRGAFTVEGNTIKVIADFMTYFNAKNVKAYIAVNEKTTTGNVGTNGEKEFHHIMLKFLNDANGNTLNINAGEHKRLEFSYDMSQTFMEDINDLEVALWLQDDETKEVYNSHFAYEYTEHCYPVRNMTSLIDGNNVTIKWDAPEKGNPVGYNVIVNGKLAAEKTSSLEYSSELNGKSIVEVVAVYADDKTSVGCAKLIINGDNVSEEMMKDDLRIYPNPAGDVLFLATEMNVKEVAIYDIYGRNVSQQVNMTTRQQVIDVANLETGIYFINIKTDKGNIVKRFIKN